MRRNQANRRRNRVDPTARSIRAAIKDANAEGSATVATTTSEKNTPSKISSEKLPTKSRLEIGPTIPKNPPEARQQPSKPARFSPFTVKPSDPISAKDVANPIIWVSNVTNTSSVADIKQPRSNSHGLANEKSSARKSVNPMRVVLEDRPTILRPGAGPPV